MKVTRHGRPFGSCVNSCCLRLENVSVRLQGEPILEDVSFHLHCGEIAALIGPNGAGKSSLFRCILGQMPYSGSITFSPADGPALHLDSEGGDAAATNASRPLVGYVPQTPSFDRGDPVSVLDFFTAATDKWPVWLPVPKYLRQRAELCLARVHGEELLDKPMGALSGGELQRVLLALALEPVPSILILDEPLSGIDIEGAHQLTAMLDEIRSNFDLSIFLSTHDFATLEGFAEKVLLLNRKILKSGPPNVVLSSPEFYDTFHLKLGTEGRR